MTTQTAEDEGRTSETPSGEANDGLLGVQRVTGFGDAGLAAEWEKYCGHIDFTVREFMDVQARLLQEQIHLIIQIEEYLDGLRKSNFVIISDEYSAGS